MGLSIEWNTLRMTVLFVEPACGELDIVLTMTGQCMCMRPSEFVWTITYTIMDGFQNNLTQLFSITCRCAF